MGRLVPGALSFQAVAKELAKLSALAEGGCPRDRDSAGIQHSGQWKFPFRHGKAVSALQSDSGLCLM